MTRAGHRFPAALVVDVAPGKTREVTRRVGDGP